MLVDSSSSSVLGASDMPYILPDPLLRVSQKPKSHLEILNEPVLLTVTSADEAGHWAARVKGPASCVACFASSLLRMIIEGLMVRDHAY